MESAQVEFLWKAISLIPQKNRSSNLLKCHLMSVCRSLDGKGDVQLPMKYTQKSTICQHCSNIWKNGKYAMKILPQRVPPKSVKKIVSRYNKDPSCLRKFEIGFAKKYAQQKNTVVITCGVCSMETEIDVLKPKRKIAPENVSPAVEPQFEIKRKKKRHSKDPTAGLIIPPQENSAKKMESMSLCLDNGQSSKSDFSTPKTKYKGENNDSPISREMMITKMAKKKKRKLLKSDSESTDIKHYSRLKIQKKPVSYQHSALNNLIKNNKMANILAKSSKSSESPLSKFLSSL